MKNDDGSLREMLRGQTMRSEWSGLNIVPFPSLPISVLWIDGFYQEFLPSFNVTRSFYFSLRNYLIAGYGPITDENEEA